MTVAFEFEIDEATVGLWSYPGNVAGSRLSWFKDLIPSNLHDLGDGKPVGFYDPTTKCTGEWQIQRVDTLGRAIKAKPPAKKGVQDDSWGGKRRARKAKAKASGDAINALMAETGLKFPEAVAELAVRRGG